MQESKFTELMADALGIKNDPTPKMIKARMTSLADRNEKAISEKRLLSLRAPTTDELITMREWAIQYKREHKNATKREVRKATQNNFNIRIFR